MSSKLKSPASAGYVTPWWRSKAGEVSDAVRHGDA
jgi:hypothetical protein